ncbi:S8 family serine peptidase [Streptomyces sp. NPDC020875]|uniref:S8 family serine peptidase n=1 Tax=Streptomyces sp. NPDC020875 TaxID=3154898 RepID=UPI0033D6FFE8
MRRIRGTHTGKYRGKALGSGVAIALGLALTAGLTSTATAETAKPGGAAGTAGGLLDGASKSTGHTLTLITGDRVTVDTKGRTTAVVPARGREGIAVRSFTERGRNYAIPYDAERLIAAGKVDRRLFDLTALARPEARRIHRDGLRVIVAYEGSSARSAKAGVRAADGGTVRRSLPTLNADAVTMAPGAGAALWNALTDSGTGTARGGTAAKAAAGVEKIWLDAAVGPVLDRTTTQIGAPAAWSRSYDGTGVRIAVLDTGIDGTHPDLAGRVVAERDFSGSADAKDRNGHGTHVASTAAGRGVKDARFKGVAPGATLINGKVLGDSGGGAYSDVVAGIEWAVAQGADVVNMSLGGEDTPGIDPLEEAVNRLSAQRGVLFAVAAGNWGPGAGWVSTPGSADAALTVGAVDDNDVLAEFSSRGPAAWGGPVKPDVTAPGVAVTAAAATGTAPQDPPGYATHSGTSMATPHVAGAAAVLRQQNPTWTGDRIKALLTGTAKPGAYTPHEQGAGRIALDRAIGQPVVAEPSSLSLGTQLWPHQDDAPVSRTITYRNTGTAPVTLDLSVDARNPAGGPAPAGFLTLDTGRVTVPAGGTASVGVTADTRIEGGGDGHYTAAVTATGGDGAVRVPVVLEREVESYDLTLNAVGRDGATATGFTSTVFAFTGRDAGQSREPDLASGTAKVRLPKGRYALAGASHAAQGPHAGHDQMIRPELVMDRDVVVTLDARETRPVRISVPDPAATPHWRDVISTLERDGQRFYRGLFVNRDLDVRTAHLGPDVSGGTLRQSFNGSWVNGTNEYHTAHLVSGSRFSTGTARTFTAAEFATVEVGLGQSVGNRLAALNVGGHLADGGHFSKYSRARTGPEQLTVRLSTAHGIVWRLGMSQHIPNVFGGIESVYDREPQAYTAGETYRIDFNTAAHGPLTDETSGVFRDGNTIRASMQTLADGHGHSGGNLISGARTTLHRGTALVADLPRSLFWRESVTVPAADGLYTLKTYVTRSPEVSRIASKVEGVWTFRSAQTAQRTKLPLSVVRFAPATALDGTAPAGRLQTFPVTVQGPAAGANLKALAVFASTAGAGWQRIPVIDGKVTIENPEAGKSLSLRAVVADRQGNTGTVTIHDAYFGK